MYLLYKILKNVFLNEETLVEFNENFYPYLRRFCIFNVPNSEYYISSVICRIMKMNRKVRANI